MIENTFKIFISTAIAAFSAYLGELLIPTAVLLAVMILDYISGMAKAYKTQELNSRIGVLGALKKLGYIGMVCVGMIADWLISSGLSQTGIILEHNIFIGALVIIWLIVNELISILENLSVLGVPEIPFLSALMKKLKISVSENSMKGSDETE